MGSTGCLAVLASLFALAATACGDEGGLACRALGPDERDQVVDHDLWVLSAPSDDPFAAFRPDDISCPDGSRGAEDFAGAYTYGVNSAQNCGYTTVHQPLLTDVCAGDTLYVWLWHFALTAPVDASATLAVQIGDERVWEVTQPIPSDSRLFTDEVTIEGNWPAGTPIYYHVRNHGSNSYNLIELSRTLPSP